jgi:hypothetical protein
MTRRNWRALVLAIARQPRVIANAVGRKAEREDDARASAHDLRDAEGTDRAGQPAKVLQT